MSRLIWVPLNELDRSNVDKFWNAEQLRCVTSPVVISFVQISVALLRSPTFKKSKAGSSVISLPL